MRLIIQILFVLTIGFGVGGTSAWYSIQRSHGFGAINIGQWTAWPFSGGTKADPYTIARVISDSTIPLGAAEGLSFEANEDVDGDGLRLECDYLLEGRTPKARLWTLAAYRNDGKAILPTNTKMLIRSHTHSQKILRLEDGTFQIYLGPSPAPGNWLATAGKGPFRLVLRLYDTPITSSVGLVVSDMPRIRKVGCAQ